MYVRWSPKGGEGGWMGMMIVRLIFCVLILFSFCGCAGVRFGQYYYYPSAPYDYTDPYNDYYYYNYYYYYYPYGYYAPYEPKEEEKPEGEKPEEYRRNP
jgi:hypothetical protein